jgi:hypothetical protein
VSPKSRTPATDALAEVLKAKGPAEARPLKILIVERIDAGLSVWRLIITGTA